MSHASRVLAVLPLLMMFGNAAALAQWPANGAPLCTATGNQNYPVIVYDGHGAIVAWEDHRSGNTDIYASRMTPAGYIAQGWPANGLGVCTAANVQEIPVIASDGSGGCFIAWQDLRGGDYDIYAQRIGPNGQVAPGWPAGGRPMARFSGDQYGPGICSDGSDGAFVAWVDTRGGTGQEDIYVQHVLGSGDLAAGWDSAGIAVCSATGTQTFASICSDERGGAIVVWSDKRSATSFDVYGQRVNSAGAVAWIPGGAPLSLGSGDQYTPLAVPDGHGGAFAAWSNLDLDAQVWAQHIDSTGAIYPNWPSDGMPVSSAAASQYVPQLISDGQGGAVFAWEDYRDAGDIYAIRRDADGITVPGWLDEGTPVSLATGLQFSPYLVLDSQGGVIITWEDQRLSGANNDVFATRLMLDGTLADGWTVDGDALCTAAGKQYYPTIATDGAGGAFITWQDGRPGTFDIYATRVGPSRTVTAVPPVPRSAQFSLSVRSANPSRGIARFSLALPEAGEAVVTVFDPAGRLVRELLHGAQPAGARQVVWDGEDAHDTPAPTGLYFVQARFAGGTREVKLVRL